MLSIIFLIFKVIGMILLCIIGLVLLVLIVPIRYEFELAKEEDKLFHAKAKVSWFLFAIRIKAEYIEERFDYYAKIFGIKILGNQEDYLKKKEEKAKKKEESIQKKEVASKHKKDSEKKKAERIKSVEEDKDIISTSAEQPAVLEEAPLVLEQDFLPKKNKVITEKVPDEKKKMKAKKPSEKKKKLPFLKKDSEKNKESLSDKINYWKEKAQEYQVIELAVIFKKALLRLLKHILPKRLKGYLCFGFDDPSMTGKITALAATFYPVYGKNFSLQPDFQDSCFSADCGGRGRIRLGFLLILIISLLIKKEVRNLFKLI